MVFGSRAALTFASTVSKMITRAGTFLVVAPLIGAHWQGYLVLFSAWSVILTLIVAYGFQVKVLRAIPSDPAAAYAIVKADLLSMATLAIPASLLAVIASRWLVDSDVYSAYYMIFFATILSIIADYTSCALRGLDKYKEETQLSFLSATAQFVLIAGLAVIFKTLLAVATGLLLSRTLVAACSVVTLFRQEEVRSSRVVHRPIALRTNITASWPYFLDASVTLIIAQLDVILLGHFADKATVGIYGAGSRFVALFLSIPWMLTNIAVPRILRSSAVERVAELRKLKVAMAALAGACAFALCVVAPFLTLPVLGNGYAALNTLWPFLALLVLSRFFEATMAIRMLIEDKMAIRAKAQMLAAGMIVLLGIPAIQVMGSIGLVLSLSCTAAFTGIFYIYCLGRSLKFARVTGHD